MTERAITMRELATLLNEALERHGDHPLRMVDHDTGWEMPARADCLKFFHDAPVPYFLIESAGYGSQHEPICPIETPTDKEKADG